MEETEISIDKSIPEELEKEEPVTQKPTRSRRKVNKIPTNTANKPGVGQEQKYRFTPLIRPMRKDAQ